MGDSYQIIVDRDVLADDAPALAERMRAWLVERGIIQATVSDCILGGPGYRPGPAYAETLEDPSDLSFQHSAGLRLNVGHRIVFHAVGGQVTCRFCAAQVDLAEHGETWGESVDAWYAGDDAAAFTCPVCGRSEHLTEWTGRWPWGFGSLGLEFWNWTPLSDRFVQEVAKELRHRTTLVSSEL